MVHFLSPDQLAINANVSSLNEYASLIICILGHGEKDAVIGVDGSPVYLNQIQYAFNGDILRDKPKIFIILACRSDRNQLILDRNDSILSPPNETPLAIRLSNGSRMMPPLIDFISLMSNLDEFQSHFGDK